MDRKEMLVEVDKKALGVRRRRPVSERSAFALAEVEKFAASDMDAARIEGWPDDGSSVDLKRCSLSWAQEKLGTNFRVTSVDGILHLVKY